MASGRTNFTVGLFVITGIIFAVAVIIYVGASSYFDQGNLYAAYFDESVQGLSKDSPVKYRGVSVGKVQDIRIAKDAKLIEVILQINPDWSPQDAITAQLKSIGITGLMFVELDLKEDDDDLLVPTFEKPSKLPIIPTRPSEIQKILDGIAEIVQQMKRIDLPGISDRLKTTIDTVNDTVNEAAIDTIAAQLAEVINKADKVFELPKWKASLGSIENAGVQISAFAEKAKTTTSRVDTLIVDNKDKLQEAIDELRQTLQQASLLMQNSSAITDTANESMHRIEKQLTATIQNLEEASRHISRLTNKSADQPSQLFFAAPPPAKPIDDID